MLYSIIKHSAIKHSISFAKITKNSLRYQNNAGHHSCWRMQNCTIDDQWGNWPPHWENFRNMKGASKDGRTESGENRWPTGKYYAKWETDARLPRERCSYFSLPSWVEASRILFSHSRLQSESKKKEKKIVEEPPRDTPGRLFAAEILVALFLPRFSERTRERISKDGGISALRRKQRDFCPRCSPLRFLSFFFSSFRNSREIYKCNARNNIFQSLQLLSIIYAARTLIVVLDTRYSCDFLIANA